MIMGEPEPHWGKSIYVFSCILFTGAIYHCIWYNLTITTGTAAAAAAVKQFTNVQADTIEVE